MLINNPFSYLFAFISEFFARGLLWARVVALGALMPVEDYGMILIVLGIEGLLAAVIAYPSIKDLLVRQSLSFGEISRFLLLFAIVSLPVSVVLTIFTDFDLSLVVVILAATLGNAIAQLGLYMLRVADFRKHNLTKLAWAVLTTALFLWLLPAHLIFLPIIYGAGSLLVLLVVVTTISRRINCPAFIPPRGYHLRGSLIYGAQALLNNFPQYGVRLFVAAGTTLTNVAVYVQTYMIATALFFAFSTVMIVVEPRLSRAAGPKEILQRIPFALHVSGALLALSFAYAFVVGLAIDAGLLTHLLNSEANLDIALFVALMIFIALNGVHTVTNCLVLASSSRTISLMSTALGATAMFVGLIIVWPQPELVEVGVVVALAQVIALLTLIVFVARLWCGSEEHAR